MAQNADAFVDVVGLLARDSRPDTAAAGAAEPAAPAVLDCRTALLAPEDARRLPTWQPLAALLAACRDDPARFQAEVLGRPLWSKQVAVCHAIAQSPVTVVPAGRAVGKSFLLAGTGALVALHPADEPGDHHRARPSPGRLGALERDPPGVRAAAAVARLILGYDHLTEGYSSPQRLTVKLGTDWGALGFAAQYEEGFSGQHAGDLLVIVDEASGVTAPIWSAIHGLAATRLVVAGNPIRYDCHFRELHDLAVQGSSTITSVPISSLESPDAGSRTPPSAWRRGRS